MNIFTHPIHILKEDIDQIGHVNNIVYLRWVQEAAIAHWNDKATQAMKTQLLWVVGRHEIDYLSACYLNSRLVAKTWVGQSAGVKSERFVDIVDIEKSATVARIKTTWILLDAQTKRPKRVSAEMMDLFA